MGSTAIPHPHIYLKVVFYVFIDEFRFCVHIRVDYEYYYYFGFKADHLFKNLRDIVTLGFFTKLASVSFSVHSHCYCLTAPVGPGGQSDTGSSNKPTFMFV